MSGGAITAAMLTELTAKERKALFVRIAMQGNEASTRLIPRFRLNPANVNRVFNCDIEYLQEDATGTVVWPKNWVTDCLPPPYLYFVREKVWPQLDPDALEQDEYRGKSIVVVDNAPEEATQAVMLTWLNAGLDDDDPDLATAKSQLLDMEKSLVSVNQQIKELPTLKGQGANAKEELENKRKRAETLSLQKSDLEESIRKIKAKEAAMQQDRLAGGADSGFRIKLAETKMPTKLNVWEVRFGRDRKAQRQAFVAVHKYNWAEFRVAVHKQTSQIITGKVEMPDLTSDFQEINMRNITVSRRKHGVGLYKFADERGFYSGLFRHGLRHGMGTEVNQQGRFQGHFSRDWRRGPGSQVCANGDSFRGPYGGSRFHIRESLIFGDEYSDGLRHGQGRMRFVDGSVYDGEFRDGVPNGTGKYVSAIGLVLEGQFSKWACLHGYGSCTVDDVTRIGTWRDGLMHGRGTEIDLQTGTYEGDFRHGERHGFGVLHSKIVEGTHSGWYHHGHRWGRGVLNFGNIERDKEAAETRMRKIATAMRDRSMRGTGRVDEAAELEAAADAAAMAADGRGEAPSVVNARAKAAKAAARAAVAAQGGVATLSGVAGLLPDLPGATLLGRGPSLEEQERQRRRALELEGAGTEAEAAELDALLDDEGQEKRVNEYEKMLGEPDTFLPYRGDYCFEGKWRAGAVRTGGIFTSRLGRTEPHMHVLRLTTSGNNPKLPGLSALEEQEDEILNRRGQLIKSNIKEALSKRLSQEADNLTSFVYWKRYAERQQKHVRRKTRRGKGELEAIKAAIKKPERVLNEDEIDDDLSEGENANDDAAPDDDAQDGDAPPADDGVGAM